MNLDVARRVADAVLYEGYLLYPYRASAQKNRSRWQFGVLTPPAFAAADPSETAFSQAECVVEGVAPAFTVLLRFLQVQRRRTDGEPAAWDEAVEREVAFNVTSPHHRHPFAIDGGADRDGPVVRHRQALTGAVTVTTEPLLGPWQAHRLRVRVDNDTPLPGAGDRDAALPGALVASHTIIGVTGGAFVSMVDPPRWAAEAVAGCVNTGTWPVLAGAAGQRDVLLCAPFILYDHPEIAPESPGDLFDGTEIDEILSLRTLALSDAEKVEARATDARAAAVIDRTEALDDRQWERMHGALRPVPPGPAADVAAPQTPWWDPDVDARASPTTDTVVVAGQPVGHGSRVRLRPGARRADAQDMFLAGRFAQVEAVLSDVDDNPYLAVTLADDPGADLQRSHGRFLYFAPDEVEPCDG